MESDNWKGPVGFIHLVVEKHLPADWWNKAEWYLCGPPMMVNAVENMLYGRGIKKEDVAFDKF
jgi:Na+-transporting NADH:ubiquinone oxidoreductase subunit F